MRFQSSILQRLCFTLCITLANISIVFAQDAPPSTIQTGVFILDDSVFVDPTSLDVDRDVIAIIQPKFGELRSDESGQLLYSPWSVNEELEDEFLIVTKRSDEDFEIYRGSYDPVSSTFEMTVPRQIDITQLALGSGTPGGFNALMLTIPPTQSQQSTRKIIIGIHSGVGPNAGFTEGHVWISVHDSDTGVTTTYGLWPDDNPRVPDNGSGSDVRTGVEDNFTPKHSRYKEITPEQLQTFEDFVGVSDTWGYTHTCAEWATDAWQHTTNEWINPNDNLGYETPRMVSKSIIALEANDPSSPGGGSTGGTGGNGGAPGGGGQGGGGTSCCGG
jgi:hypothetical protein